MDYGIFVESNRLWIAARARAVVRRNGKRYVVKIIIKNCFVYMSGLTHTGHFVGRSYMRLGKER